MSSPEHEALMKLLSTQEELDPELEPFVEEIEDGGPFDGALRLAHPLVLMFPFSERMNAQANAILKQKKASVQRAIEKGNWDTFVFLRERPFRMNAYMTATLMAGDPLPDVFLDVWSDTELPSSHLDAWVSLWKGWAHREPGYLAPSPEDLEVLMRLRDQGTVQVWRGVGTEGVPRGLSWTLNKKTAMWFAERFTTTPGDAHVICGWVPGNKIISYTNARREEEVVVLPDDVLFYHEGNEPEEES